MAVKTLHTLGLRILRARDRRGEWQALAACERQLQREGASPMLAKRTTEAMADFSRWLRDYGRPVPGGAQAAGQARREA